MVGLPARGKSYTARRIERYLSWLGYRTGVFNVGEYRRASVGARVPHSFFDPDNPQGEDTRRSVAMLALEDMVTWLTNDGQVAIYDATNSARARRAMVHARCERAGFQVLFIEIRCDDPYIIEANIRSTKLSSPDYEDTDPDEAVTDFRARIAHYQRVYQPLDDDEGAYLRVTGAGRGVTVSNVDGYLAARPRVLPDEPASDRAADLAHPPRRERVQCRRFARRRSRLDARRPPLRPVARRVPRPALPGSQRRGDLDKLTPARGTDRHAARSHALGVARARRDRRRHLRQHEPRADPGASARRVRGASATSSTTAIRAASRTRTLSCASTRSS